MRSVFKIACFLVMPVLLLSCSSEAEERDENDGIYSEGEFFYDGFVCVSEDKRITIESGDIPTSGTCQEFWTKWKIVDENGKQTELRFTHTGAVREVHTMQKSDGSVFYIVMWFARISSGYGVCGLEAYRIYGDSIRKVNVIDGGDDVDNSKFYVEYEICSWEDATNGAGFDWMFEYEAESKSFYVPLLKNQMPLDKYDVWRFDGDKLVNIGCRPHRELHEDLCEYDCLAGYFVTRDYIVRVDQVRENSFRYASWRKPKTFADKPDIVVYGGEKIRHPYSEEEPSECTYFNFNIGDYEYIVNYYENNKENGDSDMGCHYLVAKNKGKIILKQKCD